MKVKGFDPLMSVEEMAEQGITKVSTLDMLLSKADFLSLHTPDVMEAEDLIRSDTLNKCKVSPNTSLFLSFFLSLKKEENMIRISCVLY